MVIEYFNYIRDSLSDKKTFGFSGNIPEGTPISDVLNNIEQPIHSAQVLEEVDPQAWASEQLAGPLLEAWESGILLKLHELERTYDKALGEYVNFVTYGEKYKESMSPEMFDDLFFSTRRSDLAVARSNIEGYIGTLETDDGDKITDAINTRIDELNRKVSSCPIEKEMFSTFPR